MFCCETDKLLADIGKPPCWNTLLFLMDFKIKCIHTSICYEALVSIETPGAQMSESEELLPACFFQLVCWFLECLLESSNWTLERQPGCQCRETCPRTRLEAPWLLIFSAEGTTLQSTTPWEERPESFITAWVTKNYFDDSNTHFQVKVNDSLWSKHIGWQRGVVRVLKTAHSGWLEHVVAQSLVIACAKRLA